MINQHPAQSAEAGHSKSSSPTPFVDWPARPNPPGQGAADHPARARGHLNRLPAHRTWMRRTGLFRRSGQTSDGPVGLGTAYLDATRMGTFRGEVTDYEPPARIGFRETLRWFGSDLMEARPEYMLETDRDKTIVHHVAEGELFGMMRLMKPAAALLARSERARTVESLKRSLESDPDKATGGPVHAIAQNA